MSARNSNFLYNQPGDAVANGTTFYVEVPVTNGTVGGQIAWLDAISAATITLELTSFGMGEVAANAAASYYWKDSGVAITGPAASAAGSTLLNVENVRQSRARLRIVTTAISKIQVLTP